MQLEEPASGRPAYNDMFRGTLSRVNSVDVTELMDGRDLQRNSNGGVGELGAGRRESSILGRILHPHYWYGWQRPIGVGPVGMVHPRASIPLLAMVGTSVGAFHVS